MRRRTAGEVINATLLEIFILLVFVLMVVAAFTNEKLEQKAERLEKERKDLIKQTEAAKEKYQEAKKEVIALQKPYMSEFKPACDSESKYVMDIFLRGRDALEVGVNEDIEGHQKGEQL